MPTNEVLSIFEAKKEEYFREIFPDIHPCGILLGGQGAVGKGQLNLWAERLYPERQFLAINGDNYRAWHPKFDTLCKDLWNYSKETQIFSNVFTEGLIDESVMHRYSFVVDGVNTFDPKGGEIQGETRAIAKVHPTGNEFFALKNVPHGAVAQRYYFSKTLNQMRRMHVWTPAGYEKSADKLPVLYLVHGGGDTDNSWPGVGAAGLILDNLLAEGKIEKIAPKQAVKT